MTKNKSKVYGYYGGVTNENHYTPPASPELIPQPISITIASDVEPFDNSLLNDNTEETEPDPI